MSKKVCTFAPAFERWKHWKFSIFNFQFSISKSPGGGMVDTVDSKSAARKGVRVQVPPGVQNGGRKAAVIISTQPLSNAPYSSLEEYKSTTYTIQPSPYQPYTISIPSLYQLYGTSHAHPASLPHSSHTPIAPASQ